MRGSPGGLEAEAVGADVGFAPLDGVLLGQGETFHHEESGVLGYVELLSDMRWRVNGGDLLGSGIHGDTAQVMELGIF